MRGEQTKLEPRQCLQLNARQTIGGNTSVSLAISGGEYPKSRAALEHFSPKMATASRVHLLFYRDLNFSTKFGRTVARRPWLVSFSSRKSVDGQRRAMGKSLRDRPTVGQRLVES